MKKILEFIKKTWNQTFSKFDFKGWIILILASLCICFYTSWRHEQKKSLELLPREYTDSLYIYKNRVDEAYIAKDILILEKKELKEENEALAKEVKSLKDNPIIVTETIVKYVVRDTIQTQVDSVKAFDSDIKQYEWSARDPNSWYAVAGVSTIDYSKKIFANSVNSIEMQTKLNIDLIEQDDKLTLVAKSDNPYITFSSIDGIMIDPAKSNILKKHFKQKRWGVGPYVGFGVTTSLDPAWSLGMSVHYSIFSW